MLENQVESSSLLYFPAAESHLQQLDLDVLSPCYGVPQGQPPAGCYGSITVTAARRRHGNL